MTRLVLALWRLVLWCPLAACLPLAAAAQGPIRPDAAPPAISADQARAALDVLGDPAKRAAFAATLGAIIAAQPAGDRHAANGPPGSGQSGARATAAAATPATGTAARPAGGTGLEGLALPLAPDSLGAQVLVTASAFVNRLGTEAKDALDAVQSLPLLYGWAVVMATNPTARALLSDASWRVALALACAAAVQYGLGRAVRRPIRLLEATAPRGRHAGEPEGAPSQPLEPDDNEARAEAGEDEPPPAAKRPSTWLLLRRVPLVLARLLLELVPVLGIAVTGHLIAGSSIGGAGAASVSRLVVLAVTDAYATCAAVLCLARMLLSPGEARLRLFHVSDGNADYLMRWIHRLALVTVFGYAIGETGLLLGLSDAAYDLLEKTVGLVLHLSLAVIVLQRRGAVRRVLAAPEGRTGPAAMLRNRFAAVWHWIALFFLISSWLVWAVEVPHGYALMLHYFVLTALVLIGARLALLLLLGVVDRVMGQAQDGEAPPRIKARLRIYQPVVAGALRLAVYLLCLLGLLQLYGMNTFLWLTTSGLGLRILSTVGTSAVTVVLAFAVWEAVNASVQSHLDKLQREAQIARSARLRTLLPLMRTVLLICIAVFAGLMVLSEVGVNIAPLLAGAGIVGVAIGFGSQKLVQDLITGIFLLLENAMQVGDWVTVSGLSGSVEALSVRTIRLRAGDGSVHLIPFSSVTNVTNVNRGLGNAPVSVTVDYEEDTDRVSAELKAIVDGMREEPDFSAKMLSDFQLWGVDKVDGAGVTIAGQVVCTDSGRWPVQREFNRRMKQRFQELGIKIHNPLQTISVRAEFPADPRAAAAPPGGAAAPAGTGQGLKGGDDGHAQAAD